MVVLEMSSAVRYSDFLLRGILKTPLYDLREPPSIKKSSLQYIEHHKRITQRSIQAWCCAHRSAWPSKYSEKSHSVELNYLYCGTSISSFCQSRSSGRLEVARSFSPCKQNRSNGSGYEFHCKLHIPGLEDFLKFLMYYGRENPLPQADLHHQMPLSLFKFLIHSYFSISYILRVIPLNLPCNWLNRCQVLEKHSYFVDMGD